jgi:hypothetical protein
MSTAAAMSGNTTEHEQSAELDQAEAEVLKLLARIDAHAGIQCLRPGPEVREPGPGLDVAEVRLPAGVYASPETRAALTQRSQPMFVLYVEPYYTLFECAGVRGCEELLRLAARVLTTNLPDGTHIGLLAPDMLVAFDTGLTDTAARTLRARLHPRIAKCTLEINGREVPCTLRLGVACSTVEDAQADAKRHARPRVLVCSGPKEESRALDVTQALATRGLTPFFFPPSAHRTKSARQFRVLRRGLAEHDFVLLLCAKSTLERPGVVAELQHILAQERGENILVPVAMDDYLEEWECHQAPDLPAIVRARVMARLADMWNSDRAFSQALSQLAEDLHTLHARRAQGTA